MPQPIIRSILSRCCADVVLDTGYLIALFSGKDEFRTQALLLQAQTVHERRRLPTTDAVVYEVGAAFSRVAMRSVGADIMRALLDDPNIEVVPISRARPSVNLPYFSPQIWLSIYPVLPEFCRVAARNQHSPSLER